MTGSHSPASEFEIIHRWFSHAGAPGREPNLGVGDDCALVDPTPGTRLAITTDTLVEGVHFFPDTGPEGLGHKTLAVSLSDIAAMGATPAYATLALTLPEVDETWLESFTRGFFRLADEWGVSLIGGDTTRGPRVITVQLIGELPGDQGLRRSGARVGDLVFVSGTLGDAAAALRAMEQSADKVPAVLRRRLERPEPRLSLGSGLLGVATAAIDLSDGLAQDLGHLVRASAVGATVRVDRLPLTDAFKSACPHDQWLELALAGGDDYELGFTAPPDRRDQVMRVASESGVCVTEIGRIDREPGLRLLDSDANAVALKRPGYQHFSDAPGA